MNSWRTRPFVRVAGSILALCVAVCLWSCAGTGGSRPGATPVAPLPSEAIQKISAAAWPEADALFRQDPDWLGGDGAFSIDLGGERTLWLFGDSLIAKTETRERRESDMVRNTVAIQTGSNPSTASIEFYWRTSADGLPASFFPERNDEWLWPAHGVCIDNRLTIFLYRLMPDLDPESFGFGVVGWTAMRTVRGDTDPLEWVLEELATPNTSAMGIVGAALVHQDDHVYAYVVREPGNNDLMLLRWKESAFSSGDLMSPQWWGGPERGWGAEPPAVVMKDGATEFSVSRSGRVDGLVQVQSHGFGASNLALRFAPRLTGPWTGLRDAYRPPEVDLPGLLLYAGKAHPHLKGADLVATYVSNAFDPDMVLSDDRIYFPRFVRINFP